MNIFNFIIYYSVPFFMGPGKIIIIIGTSTRCN